MYIFRKMLMMCSVALVGFTGNLSAQNKKGHTHIPVFNSPNGPVLLFSGSSINGNARDAAGNQYLISRSEKNENTQKQLTIPGIVKSLSAFKKMVGEQIIRQLQHQLKIASEDALWQYIVQHPDLSAYGLISFNIPFRTAMGAAFTDEEVRDQKGKTFEYDIEISGANRASVKADITIGRIPDFNAPRLVQATASDSIITIRWKGKMNQDIPYIAFVYRQTGDRGGFQKLSARILTTRKGDSLYYLFNEKVNGNSAYRYFIRPADLLENEGQLNSDTVNLVAVNFRKLPVISQLKARDTLNGILLSWKPLPANPLQTGIEIQRSRDSRGDYVIIDTIPASSNIYQDTKLLPHVAYYYRLCVLHSGDRSSRKLYTSVSAANQKTSHVPNAPYGITVKSVKKGVSINWQPVVDPDIYAYYVYRGSSMNGKMEVISPALKDTAFTDTASNLSRQVGYVYAVTAVSNASKESGFSEKIEAHLPFGKEKPQTPGGIRIVRERNKLKLQWEDVKKNDPSIMGYILYKHKMENKPLQYAVNKPASAEATRLRLIPVVAGIITVPYFEDTASRNGDRYEYLVSAIDRFGVESGLSATAISTQVQSSRIRPPAEVYLRSVKEGVAVQWEETDLKDVQSFAVYRRSITEKSMKKIALVKPAANGYTDKQTIQGTLYVYAVAAIGSAGETAVSIEKSIRR